ncbi:23S rRNA (adenine(2030)-N(6))-methyltransferase RlmJ [Acidisphaera sp. L21]|uniref:23S rRNA (adenine(2030)-N(6))-methyltransferase RlmJ n=1 Tax=Acidisphaera sp. L21 TaxID=1641851 RepID=UPI00131B4D9C|nr:23S rRNA (adenine(2030)-N(6))-methyltransferase RlmJ [Acidisphaera sp. L21]
MNYRHAFHAGNFADCMKHALLVWLLQALARKPAPFAVLDTHAGAGRYDLSGDAERTEEWRAGIARLLHQPPAALADYVSVVEAAGLYPGSPIIIRELLRPGDRLVCCELHPEDAATLRREFAGDPQVGVHLRDGYAALGALLPPVGAKRGLVLIDPPYEAPGEHTRVAEAFTTIARRFPTGIVAAWYPIKHRAPVRTLHEAVRLAGVRDVVAAELWLRDPTDPARLNGNGLLVRHPPYRWHEEWPAVLAALLDRLGDREFGEGWSADRVTDE